MEYLSAIEKPKKLYRMLYGAEMPRTVEQFIAMYCKAYDCNPDDAAITRHIVDAHLINRLENIPDKFDAQIIKLTQHLESIPSKYDEQMLKTSAVIKNDVIKAANGHAQKQYDEHLRVFTGTCITEIEKVAKAAQKQAPERYKLKLTWAYSAIATVIAAAIIGEKIFGPNGTLILLLAVSTGAAFYAGKIWSEP